MSDSDDEARLTSTKDEQRARQARYMTRDWLRIGVVSILGTVVLGLGLLVVTGLVDLYPFTEGYSESYIVYAGIVVVALAFGVWVWEYFGEVSDAGG